MNSRERIMATFNRQPVDRTPFWLGNPTDEAKEIYYKALGIQADLSGLAGETDKFSVLHAKHSGKADLDLAVKLQSDLIWYCPELDNTVYKHPEHKPIFDVHNGEVATSLTQPGVFCDCEDIKEVENFPWPKVEYMDFTNTINLIEEGRKRDLAIFSGMWCQIFHVVSDFFGMEEYFMKMYTNPEVVHAVTERVTDFYLQANKKFLDLAADKIDVAFFGSDLGSQLSCLMSPDAFRTFLYPYFKRIVAQLKSYNLKVAMHSCGAITEIIPDLISLGIDALHPLQAAAKGMDAEYLVKEYKKDLIFIGGVDTQHLLPFGTAQEVRDKVKHLKQVFGDGFIVSPSHEALLANVSIENVIAMSEAARN